MRAIQSYEEQFNAYVRMIIPSSLISFPPDTHAILFLSFLFYLDRRHIKQERSFLLHHLMNQEEKD